MPRGPCHQHFPMQRTSPRRGERRPEKQSSSAASRLSSCPGSEGEKIRSILRDGCRHLTRTGRQDEYPCEEARTAGARERFSSQSTPGRTRLSSSAEKLSKTFLPSTADARRRPKAGRGGRGGRHNPESSIGVPQRGGAAHDTEGEQTEWEDGGRKEKPMTISSVCHSQGSPCAPRVPLGPKAGPVPMAPPSSAIFTHVIEAARVVLHAAIIHLLLPFNVA